METLRALQARRSVSAKLPSDPAPDEAALETMLQIATRVPDHGKLAPWRVVVLKGKKREALGKVAAKRFVELHPDATKPQIEFEAKRFCRAPLVLCVLSTPIIGKIPAFEQELSTGAVCMNLLHAAFALGFGANWLTEWPAFDVEMTRHLLEKLEVRDGKIAGFIYIGTPVEKPEERARPELGEVVFEYK